MKSINVRDVPPRTLERLKRRARLHHRSLQGELHAILSAAAELPLPEDGDTGFELFTVSVGGGNWSRQDLYGDDAR